MITNLLDYLEISAEKYPDKTVFADENERISYSEFVKQAKAIGSYIIKKYKNTKNKPVFVSIDKKVSVITAFFGVLYSGNFYVPIDTNLPESRLKMMRETMKPVTFIDDIFYKEATNNEIDTKLLEDIRSAHLNTNPIYAIFTSGSTGVPKSVLISHMGVIDLVEQFAIAFNLPDSCVIGNQAPFDFDVSTKDIYLTIKNGGTMHIIPKSVIAFPVKMIEFLNINKVNTLIWATSVLRIIHNLNVFKSVKPLYLENVMFSGEVMPNKVLNYWRSHLPAVTYVNLYGPTEITCNCTYYIVNREFSDDDALPIGEPFKNTEILLIEGEICVKGAGLALGYYNNHERTDTAFIQNPLNSVYYEKIYKTGDLGKYNEKDELMYCGRKDFQIKYMGHRIELGEIEAIVNSFEFLDFCCCLFDEQRDRLVLFYQAAEECLKEIATEFVKRLPKYMLPRKIIHLEKIPLNKNGKIDRIYLKKLCEG